MLIGLWGEYGTAIDIGWGAEKYLVRVRTAMAGHGRPWQSVPVPGISQLPINWKDFPIGSYAKPPILGFSGHEIKGVADHFGGFRAWIPERSDFFKGPKSPKGPLGP